MKTLQGLVQASPPPFSPLMNRYLFQHFLSVRYMLSAINVTSFNSHTRPGGDIHIHSPEEKLQRSDTYKWPETSNLQIWDLEMDCCI